MRIMFVAPIMGRGGAEVQVKDLALQLARNGHVVAVVAMTGFEDFEGELREGGVQTYALGARRARPTPAGIGRLATVARRFKPEIVHAHMIAAILLARGTRVLPSVVRGRWKALISTSHTQGAAPSPTHYVAYRLTSRLSEHWTHVSQEGLDAHITGGALGRSSFDEVPNGVDLANFRPDPSRRRETRSALAVDDAFVWVAIGSFRDDTKDFGSLLRAFAALIKQGSLSLLLIAGAGRQIEEKIALAATLGLHNRVRFLGLRTDVAHVLNAADAFVLSSYREGMPIVLLEAAASALPVVTTAVGACDKVIRDGEGGIVVPPRDDVSLATAMARIESMDARERGRMGAAARDHVQANFSLGATVARWESMYKRLAS